MNQSVAPFQNDFIAVGTKISFDVDGQAKVLTLGDASFSEELGWYRKSVDEAGEARGIVEVPLPKALSSETLPPETQAQLPDWFERVLAFPQTIKIEARADVEGHRLLLLSACEAPTLSRLLERRENLGFFAMTWIEEMAHFFASVHEAKLLFRRITPELFALDKQGHLVFLRPDQLRKAPEEPPSEESTSNLFNAQTSAERAKTNEQGDQFGLALLIYSIIAQGIPFQTDRLPSLRIFVPDLPHGIESAIRRALSPDPSKRFPNCRALGEAILECGLTLKPPAQTYRIAASTEIGRLKKQSMPVNQDAWFIGYDAKRQRGLLLLADGISTADVGSGDLASAKVFEAVRDAWDGPVGEILRTHTGTLTANWHRTVLEAILDDANTRIFSFLKQPIFVGMLDPMTHSPGSTAILGLLDGDRLSVVTMGDSCLYVLRNGVLELHSVEQNLYTKLIQERRDPRDVADRDSLAALTHSVGNFLFDNDGGIQLRRLAPRHMMLNLCKGDRILLCSDGVPDCLDAKAEETIARELARDVEPQQISSTLCRLADEAMGADNITALVLLAD